MPSIKHPFEPDFLYQVDENGDIRVTNGNAWGVFTKEGIHLSGDIRHADPQLCVWVANNPSADGQLRSAAVTAKRS
ncbi:MAG: hypothetical protein ISP92_10895 [Pseudomonadales bacterium]|jgi:hypothetical protein|nr:hypothetical protein [Pseudomonadales bacterium]MDA0761674.1 hypothetical protein [Pseudomonadota bacterium]MDA0957980.1 hypothetical protein [Pseudomonadota bacterium]MDA1208318.1 hypothetical protein [Pseudomonadota bacterium]